MQCAIGHTSALCFPNTRSRHRGRPSSPMALKAVSLTTSVATGEGRFETTTETTPLLEYTYLYNNSSGKTKCDSKYRVKTEILPAINIKYFRAIQAIFLSHPCTNYQSAITICTAHVPSRHGGRPSLTGSIVARQDKSSITWMQHSTCIQDMQ